LKLEPEHVSEEALYESRPKVVVGGQTQKTTPIETKNEESQVKKEGTTQIETKNEEPQVK
jgi:hypothetical protein